jgi:hypothetical protein
MLEQELLQPLLDQRLAQMDVAVVAVLRGHLGHRRHDAHHAALIQGREEVQKEGLRLPVGGLHPQDLASPQPGQLDHLLEHADGERQVAHFEQTPRQRLQEVRLSRDDAVHQVAVRIEVAELVVTVGLRDHLDLVAARGQRACQVRHLIGVSAPGRVGRVLVGHQQHDRFARERLARGEAQVASY